MSNEINPEHEGCPPDCGHSDEEHEAFDKGVRDGEDGKGSLDYPYDREELIDAWQSGQSVGFINRRHLDECNTTT